MLSAKIVNVHLIDQRAGGEARKEASDIDPNLETVHIDVRFLSVERVTSVVEVDGKPAQVSNACRSRFEQPLLCLNPCSLSFSLSQMVSQDRRVRSHEWTFEGTFSAGEPLQWKLFMMW